MHFSEGISRRSLIKLMAMASPAMSGFAPSQASAEHTVKQVADRQPGRPRLFYNTASLQHMRQALASDASADAALRKRGEELLATDFVPETVAEIGGGQHANYITPANQIAEMGLTLGLLFHLTGDKRYADKLRDALLYYTHYVRWAGQGLADRVPQWHSELDTALFGFGYSTGYDALRHVLSDVDRKTIADGMVRLAVLPILNDWILSSTRIHSFDSMGHNWWGVCVAGGGLCSLALLGDDPRAQEWIDAVDAGFVQWFNYPGNVLQNRMPTFERSGPSYEGVLYTNYGVSEYLHYRLAWQNTFPGRKAAHMEPLDHVAGYFLQTLYPTSTGFYSVNFGDSPMQADVTATMLLLLACGLGTPDVSRYLEHVHTNPQGTLLTLLRQHSKPNPQGDAPTSCIYPQMGWATMRSSWENDATFLAMKSGSTWNHAHADAGSFILYKQGLPLIIDSGTCVYGRPEYTTYYRRSKAHNVILFDGAGQPEEDINYGCKFPGQMHSLIDGLGMKYAYADATGPMARWFRRNYRHWLWSGDVILVIDTVDAYTAGKIDWLLHYDGEYTANSNGSVTLKNGAAEAVVNMLYPPNKIREDIGLADHNPEKKVPYLVFYPEASAQSQRFVTAICLNPESVPTFEVLKGQDYLGVRVQTQHVVEETYLNLRSVNGSTTTGIVIGEWATDAYLLHLTRPSSGDGAVQRYFLSDGSYLRRGNRSILESLSKFTACWSLGDSVEVFSDDASASIQLAADRPPQNIRWNGSPIATLHDTRKRLVSLKRTP
jgi:hypothetical protein